MPGGGIPPAMRGVALAAGGATLLAYGAYTSMYQVDAGHAAVMFSKIGGVGDRIIMPGTQFRIPWVEQPIIFNTQTRDRKIRFRIGTRDLQMVDMGLSVLCRPEIDALPEIVRTLGTNYEERVLPSIVNETLKSITAQYTASQLTTQRMQVSAEIERNLKEAAKPFHIYIQKIAVTHLTFGKKYSDAIEAKQIALQQAEQAKYLVKQAEQDKLSTIIKAEGDAKSIEVIGKAMAESPGFIQLRQLDFAQDIAETLSKSKKNKIYLTSDTLLLNVFQDSGAQDRLNPQVKKK